MAIAYMDAGGTRDIEFGIRQELSATLQADTLYTLSVDVGNIASGTSTIGGAPTFFDLDGISGYRVELRAGNQLLVADNNQLVIPEAEFLTSEISFDSRNAAPGLIGEQLEIRLVNLNLEDPIDPAAHREVDFDNVSLDAAPVPVPPALLLLASAFASIAARRPRTSGRA